MNKAVVLLSGGMDSATVLGLAREKHDEVIAVSFDYGSKHKDAEMESAEQVAQFYGVERRLITIPKIEGSALTDENQALPTGRKLEEMDGVAPSYVPARNTILLALAASVADQVGANVIYYGAHREENVSYPDCRPSFAQAMSRAICLGTKNGVRVETPFIHGGKSEIVKKAVEIGVPLHLTHSCYQGKKPACGVCDTCQIRIDAFKKSGYRDPIPYEIDIDWRD